MSLTSYQKHFIKKNIQRLSPEEIAIKLNLPHKKVVKFAKNRIDKKKYKWSTESEITNSLDTNLEQFNLRNFLANNANYFIFFLLLVSITYFNSLGNAFVSDDIAGIVNNKSFFGNPKNLFSSLWSFSFFPHYISYKINPSVPAYFRTVNIIFHIGSIFLLYAILNLFTKKRVAIASASIFAVHSFLAETVTWISARPYGQYSFFFLLSFFFYILSRNHPRYYYYSIIAFFMTVISSEKSVVLFLIFFVYELSFGNLKSKWKKLLPFTFLGIVFAFLYLKGVEQRITALNQDFYQNSSGLYNPFIQVPVALTTYLRLIFWPDNLTLYQTELSFSKAGFVLCVIIFLIFSFVSLYGFIKQKTAFFWLSFFVIPLLPTLSPIKIAWIVAERYAYLSVVGIIVIFVLFINWLMEKNDLKYWPVFYFIFAIIVISLSARTIVRNIDWKNEDNLWFATAKVSPSGAPIHNNLGDVWARRGDYEKAISEFRKATEINPGYADAYHNMANAYQMQNKINEAANYYNKALSINPNIWQSYQNLASIYFSRGEKEKALENIQKALAINPNDPGLQNNLKIIQGESPIGEPQAPAP